MESSHTGNVVPREGLWVRVPCLPLVFRPGVFDANQVEAELEELRKKHGQAYGRARGSGRRLQYTGVER